MPLARLEEVMKRHAHWTFRVVKSGLRGYWCEITIPSQEFHGSGETIESAISTAIAVVQREHERCDFNRYDI